jgi:hypothetical protein
MFTDDSFVNVSLAFMGRLSSVSPRVLSCDLNKPAGTPWSFRNDFKEDWERWVDVDAM